MLNALIKTLRHYHYLNKFMMSRVLCKHHHIPVVSCCHLLNVAMVCFFSATRKESHHRNCKYEENCVSVINVNANAVSWFLSILPFPV